MNHIIPLCFLELVEELASVLWEFDNHIVALGAQGKCSGVGNGDVYDAVAWAARQAQRAYGVLTVDGTH